MIWNRTIIKIACPLHESRNTHSQLNGNVIHLRFRPALQLARAWHCNHLFGHFQLERALLGGQVSKEWAQIVQQRKFCSSLLLRLLNARVNIHRGVFALPSCGWHTVIVANAKCHLSTEGPGMPGARGDLHTLAPGPCKPTLSTDTLNLKIWFSASFPLFSVETPLAEGMSHMCKILESCCPMYPAASVQWSGISGTGKWSQSSVTACFILKSQFCTARPRNAAIWSDVSALILVRLNICMWASFSTGAPRGIRATFLGFLIESKRGQEVKGRKGVRKHQVNGMGQRGHSSMEKSPPKAL